MCADVNAGPVVRSRWCVGLTERNGEVRCYCGACGQQCTKGCAARQTQAHGLSPGLADKLLTKPLNQSLPWKLRSVGCSKIYQEKKAPSCTFATVAFSCANRRLEKAI